MGGSRSWLVVPALGLVAGALALATRTPLDAALLAVCGAALAAAARALLGGSAAGTAAVAIAALLGALGLLSVAGGGLPRAALACAAAGFALSEIVRPLPPEGSPWPAVAAAAVAGALDPSFVALLAIAGFRLLRGPWARPRWAAAVPLVGLCAVGLAALGFWHGGGWWASWTGRAVHRIDAVHAATRLGDALGPITAVAAISGLVLAAARGHHTAAAVLAVTACALAVDLRTATVGPATVLAASLAAGLAIGRLASMIRWPAAQALVGAAAGVLVLVAPAWTLLAR